MRAAVALMLMLAVAAHADGPRRAFVTCEADDRLVVVDLDAMKVEQVLPTGKTPHVVVFTSGGKGYVNNRGAASLTVVDAHGPAVLRTIALPAASFQLALSPDGKTLAVAHKDLLAVSFVDTVNDTVTRTVSLGTPPAGAPGGALTRQPLWSADGASVWVPDCARNKLVRVDAATGAITATLDTPAPVHYLHRWPDGSLCAVTEGAGTASSLMIVDADGAHAQVVSVPHAADEKPSLHHGALSADGSRFFVCRDGGHGVAVIDVATRQVVGEIATRPGPGHAVLGADGALLFVTHHKSGDVSVIDVARQVVVKTIPVGAGTKQSHAAWLSADGKRFYVANAEAGTLVEIDAQTLTATRSVAVGNTPMFFGVQDGTAFPPTE